ncbi:MAG: histidine kinase dimerization/phospho-acceptor domain-containing protein, partial [Chloroflexota bacterium]
AAGNLESLLGNSYPLGNGVIGRAIAAGQTQNVPDVTIDPNYIGIDSTLRSELAVPLRRGGRILGVLNIESDQWAAFDADGVQLAESLADAVALALDNAGLYQTIADERSQLDALIRSSRDGVILIGLERRTLVINAPALDMLRLPGASSQWVGRPITEALLALRHAAPAVVRSMTREIRRIMRGDESAGESEYEVGSRSVHWFSLPVRAGSAPVGRLLVLRDVTEERLLEKMRDDLTHTMVHDLRNPLTVILSALETLGYDIGPTLEEDQRQMLTIASNSTEQMLNLVKAILDVNQLEAGRMPLERGRLAVEALVAETLELEALLVGEKKQHLLNRV